MNGVQLETLRQLIHATFAAAHSSLDINHGCRGLLMLLKKFTTDTTESPLCSVALLTCCSLQWPLQSLEAK